MDDGRVEAGGTPGGFGGVKQAAEGARGLILASTFSSFADVAQAHVAVPVKSLTTIKFNSLEKIRQYPGPVLISHGDADEIVPFELRAHPERPA